MQTLLESSARVFEVLDAEVEIGVAASSTRQRLRKLTSSRTSTWNQSRQLFPLEIFNVLERRRPRSELCASCVSVFGRKPLNTKLRVHHTKFPLLLPLGKKFKFVAGLNSGLRVSTGLFPFQSQISACYKLGAWQLYFFLAHALLLPHSPYCPFILGNADFLG